MANLRKIIYLSEAQKTELFTNGTITVNNITIDFSNDDIYITPQTDPVILNLRTDITTLQNNKTDKTYVDTALATKASTATATASSDGLMSAQDKSRLDAVYADYTSALAAIGGGS